MRLPRGCRAGPVRVVPRHHATVILAACLRITHLQACASAAFDIVIGLTDRFVRRTKQRSGERGCSLVMLGEWAALQSIDSRVFNHESLGIQD